MFNLLRSSRHRKKLTDDGRKSPQPTTNAQQQSATYDWQRNVPATATSYRAALARAATKTTTDGDTYTERYRQFSESRNEAPTTASTSAAATTTITATRACIEELEDLHEFDVDNDVAVATDAVDLDEKVNLAKSTIAAPPPRTKNSKTNSAINAKDNVYTAADGKINEFIATTGALKAGRDSQNEPTEWQGRNLENDRNEQNNRNDHNDFTNGLRAIDTEVIDKFYSINETKNTVDQQPNRRDTTSLAEPPRATLQFYSDRDRDCIALISSEQQHQQQHQKNSQNSPQEQVPVVPPVRYRRHLDRTPDRSDQQTEQKRQSRLSLTLGLGSGKSSKNKSANDTANTTNKVVVDNRNEFKRSADTAATQPLRRSFFRSGKAKSVERDKCNAPAASATVTTTSALLNEDEELKRPNSKLFYKGNNKASKSVATSGTTRALQRSKEFLSDIFMARGRNHNRNRNFTTTQQQQQQQTTASPQSKSKVHIVLHSPVSTSTVKVKPTTTTKSVEKTVDIENQNYQNQNNNNNSGARSNSNCNINKRHDYVTDWTQHSTTHLETISDPSSTSATTIAVAVAAAEAGAVAAAINNNNNNNTSRIAMSNNSPKIVSNNREWRSNSAEHTREVLSARARARSEDPFERVGALASASTSTSACTGTSPKTFSTTSTTTTALNGAVGDGPFFNCASNIERNGVDERTPIDNDQCVPHIGTVPKISDRQHVQPNKQHDQVHTHQVITSAAHATNGQLNELTECDRDDLLRHNCSDNLNSHSDSGSEKRAQSLPAMGQANGKTDTPIEGNTRSSAPREFRESIIPSEQFVKPVISSVVLPTITVVDYGDVLNGGAHGTNDNGDNESGPVEQEVFYDFENESGQVTSRSKSVDSGVNITAVDDEDEIDDEVFHEQSSRGKWSPPNLNSSAQHLPRNNHGKLADVPEQEEYESNDDEEETEEDEDDDDDNDYKEEHVDAQQSAIKANQTANTNNLDNELYRRQSHRNTDSRERSPLKSTNTSDSNLSTSFPDSGIGDSQASSTTTMPQHLHSDNNNNKHNSNKNDYNSTANKSQEQQQQQHSLFERDGNSTDCDDMLLQYDELDYATAAQSADDPLGTLTTSDGDDLLRTDERLVCIESISLPDVVVESTTGSSGSNSSASSIAAAATGGEAIININGATGNSMGNVHFIPIHLEGDHSSANNGNIQQKRRSIDDSVIGSKNGKQSFTHMNGHQSKPTIEIIEEVEDIIDFGTNKLNGMRTDANNEKLKRELIEQKSRFSVQLEDAQKNVHNLQNKVTEMQAKIQKLEQELSTKTWNVERLQSELNAALKDDECVRKHLKMVENEKISLRNQYDEHEDEFRKRHAELEEQYEELEQKYQTTQNLARTLHTQLAAAQTEAEEWRRQVEKIREELEDQVCILKNALENSEAERKINQDKWQKEFEMLRTQNRDREESLMTDCEWQLRQMQRQFKDKFDKSEHERHVSLEKVEMLENALAERVQEVEHMRVYQAEVISLRGVVTEQEQSIQSLMEQIETLKSELKAANQNLEQQIEAVKKIKYKCDNAICDKERQMIYRIDEVRNEAAAFWEDKLYTEMTRLKNELESVYVDERREALNKLQTEHIEELRALTTRYTANEEELRTELAELQEKFESRNEEFLELREKSDNALLQTRMHLDRADREYQNAMCREEERREKLEDSLRKEFEIEKEQMEEKFRERLGHVKDEFAREIQITTQELYVEHQKELNKQKAKLQAERDEAMQEIADRHRKKMAAAEDQMKDIELRHQHDLKDLKATYDTEKTALDKRDISNANEIEQLHRKCRCLTNLFEEMRLRYERRDPRPEDLREIAELRSRCESQERDLYLLTDRLRELQMQMSENDDTADIPNQLKKSGNKQVKKPPPKTIPTSCDVIYEENEERDSPPPQPLVARRDDKDVQQHADEGDEDDEEDEEEEEDDDDDEEEEEEEQQVIKAPKTERIELDSKELSKKNLDLINEDDSHMITAV